MWAWWLGFGGKAGMTRGYGEMGYGGIGGDGLRVLGEGVRPNGFSLARVRVATSVPVSVFKSEVAAYLYPAPDE